MIYSPYSLKIKVTAWHHSCKVILTIKNESHASSDVQVLSCILKKWISGLSGLWNTNSTQSSSKRKQIQSQGILRYKNKIRKNIPNDSLRNTVISKILLLGYLLLPSLTSVHLLFSWSILPAHKWSPIT